MAHFPSDCKHSPALHFPQSLRITSGIANQHRDVMINKDLPFSFWVNVVVFLPTTTSNTSWKLVFPSLPVVFWFCCCISGLLMFCTDCIDLRGNLKIVITRKGNLLGCKHSYCLYYKVYFPHFNQMFVSSAKQPLCLALT